MISANIQILENKCKCSMIVCHLHQSVVVGSIHMFTFVIIVVEGTSGGYIHVCKNFFLPV